MNYSKHKKPAIELIGAGEYNSYSAEIEQTAEQSNEDCNDGSACVNTAAQEQLGIIGVIGGGESSSYSAEIEQAVSQENDDCEESLCENGAIN